VIAQPGAAHGTKGARFSGISQLGVSVAFNKFQFPFCPVSLAVMWGIKIRARCIIYSFSIKTKGSVRYGDI